MTVRQLCLATIFVLLVSAVIRSQNSSPALASAKAIGVDVWKLRQDQVKADILKDIVYLRRRDQAQALAELGNTLWDRDKAEGATLIKQGVELALDPATEYENRRVEVLELAQILVYRDVFEKDVAAGKRLVTRIAELIFPDIKQNGFEGYSNIPIFVAIYLIPWDQQLAFEFAQLSLGDDKRGFGSDTWRFINKVRQRQESLANKFFDELVAVIRLKGERLLLDQLIFGTVGLNEGRRPRALNALFDPSDQFNLRAAAKQKAVILELLASVIQKELQDLTTNKLGDCVMTATHGERLLGEYKHTLPLRSAVIEQAVALCRSRKPKYFVNDELETANDYFKAAIESVDPAKRSRYFHTASYLAFDERNYRLSVIALDRMDVESRKRVFWDSDRIRSTAKLVNELFAKGEFTTVDQLIDGSPSRHRPHIILDADLEWLGHREQTLRLLERAKAEFRKMDFPLPGPNSESRALNPARFVGLARAYEHFGAAYLNEADLILEEFIDIQNQLTRRYPNPSSDGSVMGYFCYSRPPMELIETQFNRAYQKYGRLENPRVRLRYRLSFLWSILHRNGGIGGCGITEIDF